MRSRKAKEPENMDELLAELLTSDEAFSELYRFYQPMIYSYVMSRIGNHADAEDVTAMIFEKALKNIEKYDRTRASFFTWLYQIATNSITDYMRRRKVKVEITAATALVDSDAPSEAERIHTYLVLLELIHQLPHSYQEMLVLRFFEGFSIGEIAEIIGHSRKYTSCRVYRALNALGKLMKKKDVLKDFGKDDLGEQ